MLVSSQLSICVITLRLKFNGSSWWLTNLILNSKPICVCISCSPLTRCVGGAVTECYLELETTTALWGQQRPARVSAAGAIGTTTLKISSSICQWDHQWYRGSILLAGGFCLIREWFLSQRFCSSESYTIGSLDVEKRKYIVGNQKRRK